MTPQCSGTSISRKQAILIAGCLLSILLAGVFLLRTSERVERPEGLKSRQDSLPEYAVFQTDSEQYRTAAPAYCIEYSPNGEMVAVGTWHGYIRIIRCADGSQLTAYEHPENRLSAVSALAWSRDGKLLYCADGKKLLVWDVRLLAAVGYYSMPDDVNEIEVSRDGHWLAFGGRNGNVWVSSCTDPTVVVHKWRFTNGILGLLGVGRRISGLAFSENDIHIFAATEDGEIAKWALTEVSPDWKISLSQSDSKVDILSLQVSEDSTVYICAGEGESHSPTVIQLASETGAMLQKSILSIPRGEAFAFDANLNRQATAVVFRLNESFATFEIPSGAMGLFEQQRNVNDAVFSPDGEQLAVAGDWQIRFENVSKGEIADGKSPAASNDVRVVRQAIWSADSRRIFTLEAYGKVAAWNMATGDVEWERSVELPASHSPYGNSVVLALNGTCVAASAYGSTAGLEEVASITLLKENSGELDRTVMLDNNKSFERMASVADGAAMLGYSILEPAAELLNVQTKPTQISSIDAANFRSVDIRAVGSIPASSDFLLFMKDGDILRMSTSNEKPEVIASVGFLTEEEFNSLPIHLRTSPFSNAQFSSNGQRLFIAHYFGGDVLDVASGEFLLELRDGFEANRHRTAGISNDGQIIAIAESDYDKGTGELRVIEVDSGEALRSIPLRHSRPNELIFSPDRRHLMAIMDTGNVVVFTVPSID